MPSEYTDRLGFELQETGENLNSWGLRLNGALGLIDEAIAGVATISLTGNRALTNTINTPNEARKAILVFTDGGLSAVPTITIPPEQKLYYVENRGSTYAITFTAGGVTASLPAARKGFVLCTGADAFVFDPVEVMEAARVAAQLARDQAQTAATNAGLAVSSAAGSASAAAGSLTSFRARYLGPSATNPTTDGNGNSLAAGALYFNTATSNMRVYSGTVWQVAVPATTDFVQTSRQIATGLGLSGGGDLTDNRTISVNVATQAQAQAGTSSAVLMTPLGTAQAIAAQTVPSGLALISSQVVSSPVASVDFTGLDATYDEYLIAMQSVTVSSNTPIWLRTSTDGGLTFAAAGSDYHFANEIVTNGTSSLGTSSSSPYIDLTNANVFSASTGLNATVRVFRPSANQTLSIYFSGVFISTSNLLVMLHGVGRRMTSADVDAVRIFPSGGTITGGYLKLYGMRKS